MECKRYGGCKIRKNAKIKVPIYHFYVIRGWTLCQYCFNILVKGAKK